MRLTNNIDLVRLSVDGNNICYFPHNANFKDKKINRLIFANKVMQDPVTKLYAVNDFSNIYLSLKSIDGRRLADDIDTTLMLADSKCYYININDVLNLDQSYIRFKGDVYGDVVLMYVVYDETVVENEAPYNNTVCKKLPVGEYTIDKIIDSPSYGKLMKIEFAPGGGDNFISVYDKNGKTCSLLAQELLQQIVNPIYFNHYDLEYQRTKLIISNETQIKLYYNR